MACIIEFVGRPGAGKTRACRELLDITIAEFPERIVKSCLSERVLFLGPLLKCCILLYCVGFRYTRVKTILIELSEALLGHGRLRLLSTLINAVYLDFRLHCALRNYDFVLLDQGFLQLCWANVSKDNKSKIQTAVSALYSPYAEHEFVLVRVDPSADVFAKGMKGRKDLIEKGGGYRFSHLDEACLHELVFFISRETHIISLELSNDVVGRMDLAHITSCMNG